MTRRMSGKFRPVEIDLNRYRRKWLWQVLRDDRITDGTFCFAFYFVEAYLMNTGNFIEVGMIPLSEDAGLTVEGTRKMLRRLERCGHLRTEFGGGREKVNRFFLILKEVDR